MRDPSDPIGWAQGDGRIPALCQFIIADDLRAAILNGQKRSNDFERMAAGSMYRDPVRSKITRNNLNGCPSAGKATAYTTKKHAAKCTNELSSSWISS